MKKLFSIPCLMCLVASLSFLIIRTYSVVSLDLPVEGSIEDQDVSNDIDHVQNDSTVSKTLPQLLLELNSESNEPNDSLHKKYTDAHSKNPDTVGWIRWQGSVIDYPVLYRPDDNAYYLRRNIDGEYDTDGSIYMDYRCDIDTLPLLLLHGHNMLNRKMFACLPHLMSLSTLDGLPLIEFYDDSGYRQYQIFSVMSYDTTNETLDIDPMLSLKDLQSMKEEWTARSLVPCSNVPSGVEMIILNTCWYGASGKERNLHCLVVAVRV